MTKMSSAQAATALGIKERTLRTSRSTGTLQGFTTPPYIKAGQKVIYDEDDIRKWIYMRDFHTKSIKQKVYIVWNKNKTEGYATTDHTLAISAQNGDWNACGPMPLAKAFCDAYGDNEITNIEVKV